MLSINWHQKARNTNLQVCNFLDGKPTHSLSSEQVTKSSPRDGSLLYQFGQGSGEEVDQAVANAREAFNDHRWSGLTAYERKTVLATLANLIEEHREEFALYECLDVGKPISNALNDDIPSAAHALRRAAEGIDKVLSPSGSDGGVFAYQACKPVGVVGGIIGWNYPLVLAAQKVGPALAMGNSLILKPSEYTSLSAWRLAELAIKAGVPKGVFNVVNGMGKTVGDALARHPDVDLLTFVGSSATGKQMMISAGQSNMKRLILECGGKSPYIVFDDCPDNLDALAADIVATAFTNQGALCVAGTRLLLQDTVKTKLLPKILEQTRQLIPQDPLDPETNFGALINKAHLHRVLRFIAKGKKQNAELLLGGNQIKQETGGFYIEPTIFDKVNPNHNIAQEEIFGPVLSIVTFNTEEEAIQIANNSRYGLAAYAATQNIGRAQRLAQRLNAGIIAIVATSNIKAGGVELSIEGHCQSGFGMEGGLDGLKAYAVGTVTNLYT